MYFYEDNPRLQLFFNSPNQFATILGMCLMLLAGVLAKYFQKEPQLSILRIAIVTSIVLLGGGLLLALLRTYSRGGWVAYIVAGIVFLLSLKKWRRVPVFLFIIFIIFLNLVPDAIERTDMGVVGKDRSVGNRVLVWKGALSMTADHWISGVGVGQFGEQFTPWYQPLEMNTRYIAALNNFLTLSSETGIIVLFLYLAAVFSILWLAWLEARMRQHPLMLGVVCAEVVYLVSGMFTYSLTIWQVAWLFWLLFVVMIVYVVRHREDETRKDLLPPIAISVVLTSAILAAGFYYLSQLPTRVELFTFRETGQNQDAVMIYPVTVEPKGVLIYNHGKKDVILGDGKDVLRYLAEKGFIVVSSNYRYEGLDALTDVRALTKWVLNQPSLKPYPIYLVGFSLGGRLSMLTASYDPDPRIKAVATIASAASWSVPELSPKEHLSGLPCPLLIVHGDQDKSNSVSHAYELRNLCKRLKKPYRLIIVREGSHFLDHGDQWARTMDSVASFLKNPASDTRRKKNESFLRTSFTFNETGQNQSGLIIRPLHGDLKGVIIWSHGKGLTIHDEIEMTLEALANKGFIVVALDYRQNGIDTLEDSRALFKWVLAQKEYSNLPVYLSGFSLGARMALLTACYDSDKRLKAVATIGSASEWDIPKISPKEHLKSLSVPLLIIHGEKDVVNEVHEAYTLEKLCKQYKKPYELMIVKNASHDLSNNENWTAALNRIGEFFETKK
jgi:pimeloyl-ACP methyl ester carboxylesterase